LTVAFALAGLSAWQVLRGHANPSTPKVLRLGLTLGALLIPVQVLVGDLHGLNTLKHQPAKVAAMEGLWETQRGADMLLFAWPDERTRQNHFELGIPKLASLILTHDPDGELQGLNAFEGAHPPVKPVFFAFRIMVGVGLLMWATSWAAWWLYRRRSWVAQQLPRPVLGWLALMSFSGWVATLAGWYVTEIGRQPFMVYGHLRVAELASNTPPSHIAITLTGYVVVYLVLVVAYVQVLKHLARKPLSSLLPPTEAKP
jgi:cytochrome d ubiquinol oxidase subunit I